MFSNSKFQTFKFKLGNFKKFKFCPPNQDKRSLSCWLGSKGVFGMKREREEEAMEVEEVEEEEGSRRKARPPREFVRTQYGAPVAMTRTDLPSAREALMRGARMQAEIAKGSSAPSSSPSSSSSSSSLLAAPALGGATPAQRSCPSCLKVGATHVASCSLCSKSACAECSRKCDACQEWFCYMCATADYSLPDRDRVLCVRHHPSTMR